MVETKPMLVNDSYAKIFTGDDDLADAVDRRFILDINKEFAAGWDHPGEQAEQLKEAIGKKIWQVLWMPTVVGRMTDGGTMFRWVGMQVGMTMINAYKLCAGESVTGEFAYYAKHAAVVKLSNFMPVKRARAHNEPGGMPLGINADSVRSNALFPNDPIRNELESIAVAAMVYDQLWFGTYMSGGVGFTQYASATYTDNILEDFCYKGCEIGLDFRRRRDGFAKGRQVEHGHSGRDNPCRERLRTDAVRSVPDGCGVALRWFGESVLCSSGMW
jgi:methyl-coenzyme M reductase alpha subunit